MAGPKAWGLWSVAEGGGSSAAALRRLELPCRRVEGAVAARRRPAAWPRDLRPLGGWGGGVPLALGRSHPPLPRDPAA